MSLLILEVDAAGNRIALSKKNTDESDIKTNLKKPQTTQQHKQHRTKRLPEPQGTMTNAFAKALKK